MAQYATSPLAFSFGVIDRIASIVIISLSDALLKSPPPACRTSDVEHEADKKVARGVIGGEETQGGKWCVARTALPRGRLDLFSEIPGTRRTTPGYTR